MKVIAIAAVTAGGKTTVVNKIKETFPNTKSLHFDDYNFEGVVENFYKWVNDGADYNVWNLSPLLRDIRKLTASDECDYLLLDYPFAYRNNMIKEYIDYAIFIDTPLDIALARGVLRDMENSTGSEIRKWLYDYLNYARIAYMQMQKDIKSSSDYVVDGESEIDHIVDTIINQIKSI